MTSWSKPRRVAGRTAVSAVLALAATLSLAVPTALAASPQAVAVGGVGVPEAAAPTIDGRPILRTITMYATAYGPSAHDNYPYPAVNAFGQPLRFGMVAVDPGVIPLGTTLYVQGYHDAYLPAGGFVARALDEGGAIQGDRIDIFMPQDGAIVSQFGIQAVRVDILGRPTA